ncbi:hypothetical protein OAD42_05495 [Oceanospirillaceae bacterium]|nr:hypothetical protein [Oceanospirillaceae bacterium]
MLADTLKPITSIKGSTAIDLLTDGIAGNIEIYTIIKQHITIYYDYVEWSEQDNNLSIGELDRSDTYSQYDVIKLPTPALQELWVNRKLEGHKLTLVFSPPTNNHQIHSTRNLDPIELDDVYIDTRTFTKTSNNKSPKAKAYHTLAIEAALTALEKDATNSDIYKWIKNEAEDSSEEHKSYMNYLDFEGDSITPFSTASQQAVILLSNDRPITKKSFQNACSKAKKP